MQRFLRYCRNGRVQKTRTYWGNDEMKQKRVSVLNSSLWNLAVAVEKAYNSPCPDSSMKFHSMAFSCFRLHRKNMELRMKGSKEDAVITMCQPFELWVVQNREKVDWNVRGQKSICRACKAHNYPNTLPLFLIWCLLSEAHLHNITDLCSLIFQFSRLSSLRFFLYLLYIPIRF